MRSKRKAVRRICVVCKHPIEEDDYFELVDVEGAKRKAYSIGSFSCLLAKTSELMGDTSSFAELLQRFLVSLKPADYIK